MGDRERPAVRHAADAGERDRDRDRNACSGPRGLLGVVGVGFRRRAAQAIVRVVVFSVTLNDVPGAVSLVRQRILLSRPAIGLLVALLTGVLVARALTVRVLRLESTAQRVAQGDFGAHFGDSSGDELGQLARALAHMQSQLEGLEAARRRFIATASHELRTPIFSLGGFLELIQDEELDEETRRQFVGQVREQVDRLGKLATQLLDLIAAGVRGGRAGRNADRPRRARARGERRVRSGARTARLAAATCDCPPSRSASSATASASRSCCGS